MYSSPAATPVAGPSLQIKHPASHEWHVSVNAHQSALRAAGKDTAHFMYDAMSAAHETHRLALLFADERKETLRTSHRACSQQDATAIESNYLKCCLGVKCAECPHLVALNSMQRATPEQIDVAKAWTCVAHILSSGGDLSGEGYVLDVSDRMYWDNLHQSLAMVDGTPEAPEGGAA